MSFTSKCGSVFSHCNLDKSYELLLSFSEEKDVKLYDPKSPMRTGNFRAWNSGVPLLSSAEPERYQFRSDSAKESATYNTPNDAVVSTIHRLQNFSHKLASALNNKIFTSKEIGIIESTRVVCDIGTLMT